MTVTTVKMRLKVSKQSLLTKILSGRRFLFWTDTSFVFLPEALLPRQKSQQGKFSHNSSHTADFYHMSPVESYIYFLLALKTLLGTPS